MMTALYIVGWIAGLVISFLIATRVRTRQLNNRRRPDGSYAEYDFPGILNGGNPEEFLEPDLKGPGPHQRRNTDTQDSPVDLYGRSLAPEVLEKRTLAISANPEVGIRPFEEADWRDVLGILQQVIRAGETYALDRDMTPQQMHRLWVELPAATYVAIVDGQIVGTYYLKPNQSGGGRHVANCGYMVSDAARGKGVASTMCLHSQDAARSLGFQAMQYNFVASTNEGAIRLWQKLGFEIVGKLPNAFDHPSRGLVDALVMYKWLGE